MGEFKRDRLPDPVSYFDAEGVPLVGPSRWKTGPCHFHGGSDSLRVNVQSGAFRCMACGVKGGDVLAYTMQRHGMEFVQAARCLGAYVDDGRPHQGQDKPRALSAREAMELAAHDTLTAALVVSAVAANRAVNTADWEALAACHRNLARIAEEWRT